MTRLAVRLSALLALVAFLGVTACGKEPAPKEGRGVSRYGVPEDQEVAQTHVDVGVPEARHDTQPATPAATAPATPAPAAAPPSSSGAYTVVDVSDGGRVTGTCRLSGKVDLWEIPVSKCQEACGHKEHETERLVYDPATLGLANCVVYLADITKGKDFSGERAKGPDDRTALQDQHQCMYHPHVQIVRAETQLQVKNSDAAEHNIHGYWNPTPGTASTLNSLFNFGTSAHAFLKDVGQAYLDRPGYVIVKCDIHPWMNAHMFVVTQPYYVVTDKTGAFELDDVPPGTYTLVCWHEGMEEKAVTKDGEIIAYDYSEPVVLQQKVDVTAGGEAKADFTVPAPKPH
jgi:Polysaccharide lyase family 4, domain II